MAISTNGTVLTRLVGGLYNTTLSNASYTEAVANVKTSADINAYANDLYARDFAGKTDMAVANILLANLNLSGITGLNNWVSAQLTAAGTGNKGAKIVSMLNDFANMTADATYGSYAAAFNANVAAALIVEQTPGSLESNFAQAATPGELQLTTKVDTLTGHTFVSTPAYTPGGTDFVNTLQDEDTLTGTSASDDKLTLTLGGANDGAENVIAPTLNSIEIVDVKVSGRANTVEGSILGGLDFQDVAGLTTLNVNRITDNAPTGNAGEVKFENLAASTVNLSASNATRDGVLTFDYREDALDATTNALTVDTSSLRLAALDLIEGGDSNEDRGYFFETVKVNVKGATNLDAMTVAANTREDTSSANASQTITITADAALEVNNLSVAGAEFINIVANKDVVIAADERTINSTTVMLTAANNGISSTQLEKMVITGAANVSIDGLDGHFNTQDSAGAAVLDSVLDAGVTVEVDASAMTGNLFLGVAQASDGEARVDSNASLAGNDLIAIDGLDIIVTSGSGNDRIETYGALAGNITTGAGNDAVSINTGADDANGIDSKGETGATVEAVSTIDTGTGNDIVFAANLAAIEDIETARNQTFGEARAAAVTTGEGDDTVTVTSLDSADDYSNGASLLAQWDDLVYVKGATVTTGAGNDTVTFTTVAEGASVDTGAGADQIKVTLSAQSGAVLAADRNADQITLNTATVTGNTNEVGLDGAVDRLGAVVEAGEGDDAISFTEANTLNGTTETTAAAYSLVGRDAELRGGAGTDTLNVTAYDAVTVTTTTTMSEQDSLATGVQTDINANVTGIETANFTIANQINDDTADSAKINVALNLAANDNVDTDGAIVADVLRFDASLATINLVSQEKVMELNVANEAYQAGTKTAFTLMNMREGVALTLTAHEATGVGTVSSVANQIKDDQLLSISATTAEITQTPAAADVALTIDYDGSAEANDSASISIGAAADAAGRGNFDVAFTIGAATTDTTADATYTADTTDRLENFTINVTDGNSHSFNMSGYGDNDWGTAGADGSMTNVNSLTVNTGGAAVQVDNVGTDSILFNNAAGTAVTAANVTVRVDQSNNYTIVTGSGTDIIDMRADDVRADDILTSVDRADKINAGAGRDTLIVGGDDSLGNNNLTTSGYSGGLSTIVDDDVFEKIQSVEIVTVDTSESSSSAQRITLDEAAAEVANVDTINVVGTVAQTIDLVMGNDFYVSGAGNGLTAGTLLVDASVTRATADAAIGALTLNVENKDDDQDVQSVDMLVRLAAGNTAGTNQTLNVLDVGDQDRRFDVVVTTNSATTAINTNIGEAASGATTDIDVVIVTPATITDSIDSITLVEGSPILTGATTRAEAATKDTFTIASEWTRNVADGGTTAFVFDASAILNTDSATDTTGATGGATITVEAGDSARLNIKGTQNADAITSGTLADVVEGQGGNDTISGGSGADTIDGGAGDDSLLGGVANDSITGGTGDDNITGGLGADALTGGSGADVFTINAINESILSSADSISDFATGSDKIAITTFAVTDGSVVNLGRFANVTTSGDGDNSLDGTVAAPRKFDAFYSSTGQLAIDVDGNGDITGVNDIVISSANAINAGDINYTLTIAGGNNVVRLGQGVDNITTGSGNDTFVIVGAIDDTAAAGYNTAGEGVVGSSSVVVNYNDLLSTRTATEANAGDAINAGTGTDTLHVFGSVNLSSVDLDANNDGVSEIDTIVVHSSLTLTSAQFSEFVANSGVFLIDGNTPHSITVTGTPAVTAATILDSVRINQGSQGAASTLIVTGTAASTDTATFTYSTGSSNFILSVDNSTSISGTVGTTAVTSIGSCASYSVPTLTVANAAGVTTPYHLSDSAANLVAASPVVLNGATNITATGNTSLSQAQVIADATNSGTNSYTLVDAINGLLTAPASIIAGHAVSVTDSASIAQLATIDTNNTTGSVTASTVTDTAANLVTNAGTYVTGSVAATLSGTASIAQLTAIDALTTGTLTYSSVTDAPATAATNTGSYISGSKSVILTASATVSQATTIDGLTTGTLTMSLSDTASNLAAAASGTANQAANITATTAATVAQATTIEAFTNSGTNTYNITDSASALAGSSNAVLTLAGTVTANAAATAAEAATIAAFAKAVTFNTTDTVANLTATTLAGANLTEALAVGTVTVDDSNSNLATALTTSAATLSYVVNTAEVITVNGATALTVNASQFGNFLAGTVTLGTAEDVVITGNASADLGTLSAFGSTGTMTLGETGQAYAYTVNLGTSGLTTINLAGTGNHDITASASTTETFAISGDYDNGGVLRGLTTGDRINLAAADGATDITLVVANAGAVDSAGEYYFDTSSKILTWFEAGGTQVSIALIGVTAVQLTAGSMLTVL